MPKMWQDMRLVSLYLLEGNFSTKNDNDYTVYID